MQIEIGSTILRLVVLLRVAGLAQTYVMSELSQIFGSLYLTPACIHT